MTTTAQASRFDRSLVDGPIGAAVWKLAWPTMVQNFVAGMQGLIDQVLVGQFLGYAANAAIGVGWQIFVVVIVFMASIFSGQAILVARFAGAGDSVRVNRIVQQALLTALGLFVVMGTVGYFSAERLLDLVNAAPEVKVQALPFLRINFVGNIGMLLLFLFAAALRAAGDARTPLRLGVMMTVLNVAFNVVLIRGLGPIPALGAAGSALGTALGSGAVSLYAIYHFFCGDCVIRFSREMDWRPDWAIIRSLFRLGWPTGIQAISMNVAAVFLLRFVGSLQQSAAAQAAYAIAYSELFALMTWTAMGLMAAASTMAGQNLGAGHPERVRLSVHRASRIGLSVASVVAVVFVTSPRALLWVFGAAEGDVAAIGEELLRYLAATSFFMALALVYTGGLQGSGDTRSPLVITWVSQIAIPLGTCTVLQALGPLEPRDIWAAILLGNVTRCGLSAWRFRQGKWRDIKVELAAARA